MAKQASEEITYFLDHLKKTWFYFALLLFRLLRLLGDLFLTLFYLAFSSLIFVFINALRIIVLALISIYFIIKFLVPIRAKKNPFANQKGYQRLMFLDSIGGNSRVLCLDLDETLVFCSPSRPAKGAFQRFAIKQLDQPPRVYYLQKRPHLEEFLEKVR